MKTLTVVLVAFLGIAVAHANKGKIVAGKRADALKILGLRRNALKSRVAIEWGELGVHASKKRTQEACSNLIPSESFDDLAYLSPVSLPWRHALDLFAPDRSLHVKAHAVSEFLKSQTPNDPLQFREAFAGFMKSYFAEAADPIK